MKRFVFLGICLWVGLSGIYASDLLSVKSPDGVVEMRVFQNDGRLSCAIWRKGTQVLDASPLGLVVDGTDLGMNVSAVADAVTERIDERYAIWGNHAEAHGHAVEAVLPLEASGMRYELFVRAYDDGVAVRYALPDNVKRVDGERTAWILPAKVKRMAWTDFSFDYEGVSHVTSWDSVPAGRLLAGPLTAELDGCYLSFSEADCEAFPDMAFMRDGHSLQVCFPASAEGWPLACGSEESARALQGRYKGRRVSPWRSVVVAEHLTALVNSDLLTNLCPAPSEDADFSWVRPGRCLWHWWSVGTPELEEQRRWFDAAASLGWEYYLIDDGWRDWEQEGRDRWSLLEEVVEYGKSVGVGSIVWVDSKEMRQAASRRAYLERVKAIGAAGVKIDFIPHATAEVMQWYMGTMQDCAELGLLLNFHGCVKPTGLSRTYPNDITREAVRGNEYQIRRYHRVLPQSHYVSLPFTRLMAGAADVTPATLNPEEIATGGYSWTHEAAQAIVFLSPVTHFSDHYAYYMDSPMRDLFEALPTVWDDTLVLPCTEMGEVAAFARRKGGEWWVGVMNGDHAREVEIPLDFLRKKKTATLVYDDAARLSAVTREDRKVSPKEILKFHMRPGGGFVARFR